MHISRSLDDEKSSSAKMINKFEDGTCKRKCSFCIFGLTRAIETLYLQDTFFASSKKFEILHLITWMNTVESTVWTHKRFHIKSRNFKKISQWLTESYISADDHSPFFFSQADNWLQQDEHFKSIKNRKIKKIMFSYSVDKVERENCISVFFNRALFSMVCYSEL